MDQDSHCDNEPGLQAQRTLERRGKITAAAKRLFIENGFHNTGMARLAKESGVLVGQIYRDFASKEAIVADIVEEQMNVLLAASELRESIRRSDYDAVKAWIFKFVRGPDDNDFVLFAEILAESSRNEKIAAITEKVSDRLREAMVEALTLLAPDPAKAERRETVAKTILCIGGGVGQQKSGMVNNLDDQVVDLIVEMIERELMELQRS
ncbi:TetR/AcrR family transcriptional regulator [uncultured Parasphingorhabdus sp.]|uniref:TetR/AcrR family transcriptional regulator n=1 Tax=uncultured Parasphingorhabdus sp. TaxID=2709694 RepID=UPI0030DB7DB8